MNNTTDPLHILAQILPRARSEDELITLASQMGSPPPTGWRPQATPMPKSGVARFQGTPKSPLTQQGNVPDLVPPMTQGEARTNPRVGELLLGGY